MDFLNKVREQQIELNKKWGLRLWDLNWIHEEFGSLENFNKNYILAFNDEIYEVLGEINWKFFRKKKKEVNWELQNNELIDVFVFWLCLSISNEIKFDEEFFENLSLMYLLNFLPDKFNTDKFVTEFMENKIISLKDVFSYEERYNPIESREDNQIKISGCLLGMNQTACQLLSQMGWDPVNQNFKNKENYFFVFERSIRFILLLLVRTMHLSGMDYEKFVNNWNKIYQNNIKRIGT